MDGSGLASGPPNASGLADARRFTVSGLMASGLSGSQRLIVAAGLFTTLGLPIYLLFLMITAANVIGPVVLGRPLPWLLLQGTAATVGVCTAVIAATWRSRRRGGRTDDHRLILVAAGAALLAWAGYWGLLVP